SYAGLQTGEELQHALPGRERFGVLATLAHLPIKLAAGLSVHSPGRQPRHGGSNLSQFDGDNGFGRSLARRQLDLRRLGNSAWLLVDHASKLPALVPAASVTR